MTTTSNSSGTLPPDVAAYGTGFDSVAHQALHYEHLSCQAKLDFSHEVGNDCLDKLRALEAEVARRDATVLGELEDPAVAPFVAVVLLAIVSVVYVYHKLACSSWGRGLRYVVSESGAVCLLGLLAGLFLREDHLLKDFATLDARVFFDLLLPPIIFYAGYGLQQKHGTVFFSNMGTILLYAFAGTLISTAVVGLLLYALAQAPVCGGRCDLSLAEAALAGATLSAIDPVATIALFETLHVDHVLFNLVFGESVLNDAVAIVLFDTLKGFAGDEHLTAGSFVAAAGRFAGVSAGSLALGLAWGAGTSLLLKHGGVRGSPEIETMLVYAVAFVAYHLADLAELSSIMAILFYGITMGHYGYYSLSPAGQHGSMMFAKVLGYAAELFVFAYTGMSALCMGPHVWSWPFVLWAAAACLAARALHVFPLSAVANLGRKRSIPLKVQVVVWYSGLRGAIAFALSLQVDTEHAAVIRTTTVAIVLFTTVGMGGLTAPLLYALGIGGAGGREPLPPPESAPGEEAPEGAAASASRMWFTALDERYLKPFLRGPEPAAAAAPAGTVPRVAMEDVDSAVSGRSRLGMDHIELVENKLYSHDRDVI